MRLLQSRLANVYVKFHVNLPRDENTCLFIVNCLAYHYFRYFTLSMRFTPSQDWRKICSSFLHSLNWCNKLKLKQIHMYLFYYNLFTSCVQFEEFRNKEQIYVLAIGFLFENRNFTSRTWRLKNFHWYKY